MSVCEVDKIFTLLVFSSLAGLSIGLVFGYNIGFGCGLGDAINCKKEGE